MKNVTNSQEKKKIIIANWKMNPVMLKDAVRLFTEVTKNISKVKKTTIVICPPFIFLDKLKSISRRTKKILLGAQNLAKEEQGALTGEVSSLMLLSMGVWYVILGHSERRSMGETNTDINRKIKLALASGLTPVLCVGEISRDEDHAYFNTVKSQTEECLAGVSRNLISKIIIAYEPVWALSTTKDRKDATPADSLEMVIFIRKILSDKFGSEFGGVKILYGGKVDDKDAEGFLVNGGVDGLLVGRASLDAKKFVEIIKTCEVLNK
jgi:triosephosphate isomerase